MEQAEFENIARRIRDRAFRTALTFSTSTEEAEDIAQDVVLKLWTMRESVSEKASAEKLAVCMARHLAIDLHRKRRTVSISNKSNIADEKHATPDVDTETTEDEAWITERIKRLPPKEYQILMLRQKENKSNEEIAQLLGIEKSSVATMLSRARTKLLKDIKRRMNS